MRIRSLIFAAALLLAGCNAQKDINKGLSELRPAVDTLTRDVARNLVLGLSDSVALLGKRLLSGLKGAADTLDPDIRRIYHVVDSLGTLTAAQVKKIGDSLQSQIERIKADIDTKKIRDYLLETVQQLTGTLDASTKKLVADAINSAVNTLQTDSSRLKGIINNLLNDSTRDRLASFLSGALTPTLDSLKSGLHTTIGQNVPVLTKAAVWIIVALGIAALAIIGLVWYQRRRYARLTEILTSQIHGLSSKQAYDELTSHIRHQTQTENLEPLLRKTLLRQGINP